MTSEAVTVSGYLPNGSYVSAFAFGLAAIKFYVYRRIRILYMVFSWYRCCPPLNPQSALASCRMPHRFLDQQNGDGYVVFPNPVVSMVFSGPKVARSSGRAVTR